MRQWTIGERRVQTRGQEQARRQQSAGGGEGEKGGAGSGSAEGLGGSVLKMHCLGAWLAFATARRQFLAAILTNELFPTQGTKMSSHTDFIPSAINLPGEPPKLVVLPSGNCSCLSIRVTSYNFLVKTAQRLLSKIHIYLYVPKNG